MGLFSMTVAIYFLLFTIYIFVRLLFLVLIPSGTPQGVHGGLPPELLPSPPPSGWSTGFITTPLTCGLFPSHLDLPALPEDRFSCSGLLTCPIVATQPAATRLTSPEASFTWTYFSSLAISCAEEPALLTI